MSTVLAIDSIELDFNESLCPSQVIARDPRIGVEDVSLVDYMV